jgi:UDP-N-acetylglucosamine 3-dehydrogenase
VEEIRVGLVGTGALGAIHAAGLSTIPACRLALVAATTRKVSAPVAAIATAAGATIVDAEKVFDKDLVDAVVIATPTDTHAAYACRAIEAGLSVFCEKPLARTLAEAERIRDVADTFGTKVAVGHVVRYFPEYRAARDLVFRGELGTPVTARLARFNTGPAALSGWYAESGRSGGVLLDMAIHDVDWCLWAFGPAERVYAVRAGGVGPEVASLTIRHRGGTISYIDASWRNATFTTHLEMCGTRGFYRVEGSGSAGYQLVTDGSAAASYLPPEAATPVGDDPYLLELQAAFEWFRGGDPPLATVADACEAVRVVEAAEESIRSCGPVSLIGAAA